jgi:protein-S-isoprenylcysteine O-methyltransferase Ste14
MLIKGVLFILGSTPMVILSLPSLKDGRSHGFYRFFAFESILGLGILNIEVWFMDPFSPIHILSWLLLLASLYLAIHGFKILREKGNPKGSLEATTLLVTSGPYRYIRHPLYASLLYFGLGVFLKAPSLPSGVLAVFACGFLYLTARVEEKENLVKFGDEYAQYMSRTKLFIPLIL